MSATPQLPFATLGWDEAGLWLLDQTRLPHEEVRFRPRDLAHYIDGIQRMVVRGAPALGCAGAYGVVFALRLLPDGAAGPEARDLLDQVATALREARPTAVNLGVGVGAVETVARELFAGDGMVPENWQDRLLDVARAFHEDDAARCLGLAEAGLALLSPGQSVLTHCNAGALATGGLGTALAPLHLAAARGIAVSVFADETRPLRQGARLTAWEMARSGIPVQVLADGAAGSLLASGQVNHIFVGSDRIAANGDVANKIGTYPLAVLARRHGVPFHVLAPATTVDPHCPDGASIPIEMRAAEELLGPDAVQAGVGAWAPAFDVTPAELVDGIVLEDGVYRPGSAAWDERVAGLRA
jgi:methylthioribose-1-phosphate isomerase